MHSNEESRSVGILLFRFVPQLQRAHEHAYLLCPPLSNSGKSSTLIVQCLHRRQQCFLTEAQSDIWSPPGFKRSLHTVLSSPSLSSCWLAASSKELVFVRLDTTFPAEAMQHQGYPLLNAPSNAESSVDMYSVYVHFWPRFCRRFSKTRLQSNFKCRTCKYAVDA